MAASTRIFSSVSDDDHERLVRLASVKGVSVSRLLAGLVQRELAESPQEETQRPTCVSRENEAPAEKYTVRLTGVDAARLEERAHGRNLAASGYVAHLLRAHLRAHPPMPYKEFQELKRVVSELAAIHGALRQLAAHRGPHDTLELSLRENVMRLLPALRRIREDVQATLVANSKSWEAPDA